jgi:hypothetical protein
MKTKIVTNYEADDGTLFEAKSDCARYEKELKFYNELEQKYLGKRNKKLKDSNYYFQHQSYSVLNGWKELLNFIKTTHKKDSYIVEAVDNQLSHMKGPFYGIFGRVINAAGLDGFKIFSRFGCINFQNFREYQQPYYALNVDKTSDIIAINK